MFYTTFSENCWTQKSHWVTDKWAITGYFYLHVRMCIITNLWKSFESFKLWALDHLPINSADSEGLDPNWTWSETKGGIKEVAILMCLCRRRDNYQLMSWLFKPWEAWDKYIQSPAPSFHQRDGTVWVILLPLALISEEPYGRELNVLTFQKRVRNISWPLRKLGYKKEKKGKKLRVKLSWLSSMDTFSACAATLNLLD